LTFMIDVCRSCTTIQVLSKVFVSLYSSVHPVHPPFSRCFYGWVKFSALGENKIRMWWTMASILFLCSAFIFIMSIHLSAVSLSRIQKTVNLRKDSFNTFSFLTVLCQLRKLWRLF
jgi:hypothetical protein